MNYRVQYWISVFSKKGYNVLESKKKAIQKVKFIEETENLIPEKNKQIKGL